MCRLHDVFGKCRVWKCRHLREVLLFQPNGSLHATHLGVCADYSSLQWSPGPGLAIQCGVAMSVSRCASRLPAAPAFAACLCGASSLLPHKASSLTPWCVCAFIVYLYRIRYLFVCPLSKSRFRCQHQQVRVPLVGTADTPSVLPEAWSACALFSGMGSYRTYSPVGHSENSPLVSSAPTKYFFGVFLGLPTVPLGPCRRGPWLCSLVYPRALGQDWHVAGTRWCVCAASAGTRPSPHSGRSRMSC